MSEVHGKILGRYEIIEELARGGMATVYAARTIGPAGFQKRVALKRIHLHLASQPQFIKMFLDEARIAASLQHPQIAQVYDLGEEGGDYYLAMEYLHGDTLSSLLQALQLSEKRLSFVHAAHIAAQLAGALHHAHEAKGPNFEPLNIVHRDVSPQNVFLTFDGQVKLVDFGIAKAAGRLTQTQTGKVKGKYAYMAPEQARARTVDRRSDIFALGIVLWEMSVGQRLSRGDDESDFVKNIARGYVDPPSTILPGYSPELETIVMHALAAQPEDRYQTAADLQHDLEDFIHTARERASSATLAAWIAPFFASRRHELELIVFGEEHTETGQDLVLPRATGAPAAEHVSTRDPTASAPARAMARGRIDSVVTEDNTPLPSSLALSDAAPRDSQSGIDPDAFEDESLTTPLVRTAASPSGSIENIGSHSGPVHAGDDAAAPILHDGRQVRRKWAPAFGLLAVGSAVALMLLWPDEHAPSPLPPEVAESPAAGVAPEVSAPRVRAEPAGLDAGLHEAAGISFELGELAEDIDEPVGMTSPPAMPSRGRGRLTVRAHPFATVSINGSPPRNTPLTRVSVRAGRVRLVFKRRGTGPSFRQIVSVPPNAHRTVQLRYPSSG